MDELEVTENSNSEEENGWVMDLESALLEDCSATDIFCICRGKRVPANLRADVWQTCLDVRTKGDQMSNFNEIFDLPNQSDVRDACTDIVSKLGNEPGDKISIISDMESVITFYCKSHNQEFCASDGWVDILAPLLTLRLNRSETYNLFEAIIDVFVPAQKDQNCFHILRLLIQYHDPELCSLLDTKRIYPESYCRLWFRTLFAASCDLQVVLQMWDYYFQHSDPSFIYFLVLIMILNGRDSLLAMAQENERQDIVSYLESMPPALESQDVEDFWALAQYYSGRTPISYQSDFLLDGTDCSLNQFLCLPVTVADIMDQPPPLPPTEVSSPGSESIRFFIVDCRPIEQFNAGHLSTAFHLDCNLMLQEPSAYAMAVQGLFSAQRLALAHRSNAGGEHLCFVGSGRTDEDQYAHMVVASFLQKHTQYVCFLNGGFKAIHDYLDVQNGLDEYLEQHNPKLCINCTPPGDNHVETPMQSSNQPSTKQSNILGKLSIAVKAKSVEVKDRIKDYITMMPSNSYENNTYSSVNPKEKDNTLNTSSNVRRQSSSISPLNNLTSSAFSIDDHEDNSCFEISSTLASSSGTYAIPSIQEWLVQQHINVIDQFSCKHLEMNGMMYPSVIIVTDTELIVIRQPTQQAVNGQLNIRRNLSSIVKITARKKHPDIITLKYGRPDGNELIISDMDRFLIPNAEIATQLISSQILKNVNNKENSESM